MSLENIQLSITLSDQKLEEEDLQTDTENILSEIEKFDGVQKADLISIEKAEPNTKSIGGFLVGILTAEINAKNLKALVGYLGDRLSGKTVKIKAEGNGRKIDIEVGNLEDLNKALAEVDNFLKA
ncbi:MULTISPECIES: hypothetical protein [unclassified Okeania]|uniref:hypothetical protein n=1 Tax=unclassified Okeania TaxID=2634635 RepID=UPI0013BD521E|nr:MULTISPECIES: hypothetical protein [unclassified Okeania]NES77383.1 hypothetical protein [Okeania sp. SIO1H4]NET20996.1 hypothetical protein [Okeania sp. SIO1H5]NET77173.1 hypothetical protein [Okeania sp. SIO1F9]NET94226.1 hypothetical protein [Okeania sp. SIO1H2]